MADENKNIPPEGTVQVVRAFICCFLPDLVVGLQEQDNLWYLPGGIVEGIGLPEKLPRMQGSHFHPLAWYVKEQTGLTLTGLTDALQVGMYPAPRGFEVAILYAGQATGGLVRGAKLDYENLPKFAQVCGDPHEAIRKLMSHRTGAVNNSKASSISSLIAKVFRRKES